MRLKKMVVIIQAYILRSPTAPAGWLWEPMAPVELASSFVANDLKSYKPLEPSFGKGAKATQ